MLILRPKINHSFLHEDYMLWYCPTLHHNWVIIKEILGFVLNHAEGSVWSRWELSSSHRGKRYLGRSMRQTKECAWPCPNDQGVDRSILFSLSRRSSKRTKEYKDDTSQPWVKSRYQKRQKDQYLIIGEVHRITDLCAIWVVIMFC